MFFLYFLHPVIALKIFVFTFLFFKNKLSICIKRPSFKKLISHFKIYFYILNQNTSKYFF